MGGLLDSLIACRLDRQDWETKKHFYEGIFISFSRSLLGSTNNIEFLGNSGWER